MSIDHPHARLGLAAAILVLGLLSGCGDAIIYNVDPNGADTMGADGISDVIDGDAVPDGTEYDSAVMEEDPSNAGGPSDDEIRDALIQASIDGYTGRCPCPYNTMRSGARCGRRSAYDKPGGYEPLCYPEDVTDAMVEAYREGRD